MNPASLRALRAPLRRSVAAAVGPSRTAPIARALSTTVPRFNEQQQSESDKKKEDEKKKRRADDDHSAPPQSPFKVFLRVFREEIDKNQGWQTNVKQLQGDVDKLADSAAMKKAREAYERTRVNYGRVGAGVGWWS